MIAIESWLRIGLAAGLCAIAATLHTNESIRSFDGAILAGWLLLPFLAASLAAGSLHAIAIRLRPSRGVSRTESSPAAAIRLDALLAAGGVAVAAVATSGIRNLAARATLVAVLGGLSARGIAALTASRLSASALERTSRAGRSALLALGMLGALGIVTSLALRRPSDGDLASRAAGAAPPVLLIGIDGADWSRLDPLIAAGRLPNIAALVRSGTRSALRTLTPTWSPRVWTSIVTGLTPEEHGILDFFEFRLPGQSCGSQRLERRLGILPLTPPSIGTRPILAGLKQFGILKALPVTNCGRRAQSVWNLVSDAGGRVAIVSWWGTWPAEPVAGAMIADMNPYRSGLVSWDENVDAPLSDVAYPPELLASLRASTVPDLPTGEEAILRLPFFDSLTATERAELLPQRDGLTSFFPRLIRSDSFAAGSLEMLLHKERFDFSAVHLAAIDEVSHRWAQYPKLVDAAYELIDGGVGRIVAAAPAGTIVVLVSDHGWVYEANAERGRRVGHDNAPDGVFLISGPGIAAAKLEAAPHVLDIAPTLLALLGIAAEERMPGEAIQRALPGGCRPVLPRRRYADRRANAATGEVIGLGEGMTDRLRALGYLEE